jgi:hypothetical protein
MDPAPVGDLLGRLGLVFSLVADGAPLPGSYWGVPEAGLVGTILYARRDTPIHSIFHEAAHYACMSPARRARLSGDAGGDDLEECAVCYLQVLLADHLPAPMSRARMCQDMDAWGYSFREGGAAAWFAGDGRDARRWLQQFQLIDGAERPTLRLRG